jgi:hypothetical protein
MKSKKMNTVERISQRAQAIVKGQIESYRATQAKAGVVLGVIAIFIPLFSMVPEPENEILKILKLIALIEAGAGCIWMLTILVHRKIKDGYGEHVFNKIANYSEQQYLEFEIGMAMTNIETNDKSLNRMNKNYNIGLALFVSALAIVIIIFAINPK